VGTSSIDASFFWEDRRDFDQAEFFASLLKQL
jgi:hypothetical protein